MKIYGLLGHNITYSLSPAMHNAAFKKLKIEAEYRIFDKKAEDLEIFLNSLLRSEICGLNVTIPYKQNAYDFFNKYGHINKEAEKYGAINTIVIRNKSLYGYNTDGDGFMKALKIDLSFNPRHNKVFIIGAGGAGTVCALKIARAADKIFIKDTDEKKIEVFRERFLKYFGSTKLEIVKNKDEDVKRAVLECQLLVNATPFGRNKNEFIVKPEFLHKDMKIFDLIYSPPATCIMEEAEKIGIKAVNGLGMLLYQGAKSFELWTEKKAPVETMREALEGALKN